MGHNIPALPLQGTGRVLSDMIITAFACGFILSFCSIILSNPGLPIEPSKAFWIEKVGLLSCAGGAIDNISVSSGRFISATSFPNCIEILFILTPFYSFTLFFKKTLIILEGKNFPQHI